MLQVTDQPVTHVHSRESLRSSWFVSVLLHVAIISLMVVKGFVIPKETTRWERAVKVDLVGLPDKVQDRDRAEDLDLPVKPAASTPPPAATEANANNQSTVTPQAAPEDASAPVAQVNKRLSKEQQQMQQQQQKLKQLKVAQERALKMQQSLSRLEQKQVAPTAARTARHGEVISSGRSSSGTGRIVWGHYIDQVDKKVKSQWSLPPYLSNRSLQVVVHVLIGKDGKILDKKIIKSSGNPMYDETALDAIAKAEPLPEPPAVLQDSLKNEGIEFGFPE